MLTELTAEAIVVRAKELGADLVGIVRSAPLGWEAEMFERWIGLGYHGSMTWLARSAEVRNNPALYLEGCRSIIVIAVNYYTPDMHVGVEGFPRISRYAWGEDYHKVLKEILNNLARELNEVALREGIERARHAIAVDSAPFRDKIWAYKAGLGWIGKNTLLITREFGSWVFIGSLLTTLDIEPTASSPMEDFCGKCTRCIDECPTQAILKPRELDARACISYLTVEHEGTIPAHFQGSLQGWLFGCDTCQDVCPWNRFAKPSRFECFTPKPGLLVPDLLLLSYMDEEEYKRLVEGTPLSRAGRQRLRRNALAAMGLI